MEEAININHANELPDYKLPSVNLLKDHTADNIGVSPEEIERKKRKISDVLSAWRIATSADIKAIVGPTVTTYKVYPSPGVRRTAIMVIQDEIALSLNTLNVRVVFLPDAVGIEVPNDHQSIVSLKSLLETTEFRESKAALPIAIGCDTEGKPKIIDLTESPHILMAGATKQGKTATLNSIVTSLLFTKNPSELKFVFIDPKQVEFSAYARLLNHYLAVLPCNEEQEEQDNAIVKTSEKADKILHSLCAEMERRYELLAKASVLNIKAYNDKHINQMLHPDERNRYLPYIVIVINEYSDLTVSLGDSGERARARDITNSIINLAQKGYAAGLHIVMATQRPSVNVITRSILVNFPTRIAFRVFSKVDSLTIIDSSGAEKLIGRGDLIFNSGIEMERVQGAYVEGDEIDAVVRAIASQNGYSKPYYLPEPSANDDSVKNKLKGNELDEYFGEAARMVVTNQRAATSELQRKIGLGYARAGRLMDQLEGACIVGPKEGTKARQVLVENLDELKRLFSEKSWKW